MAEQRVIALYGDSLLIDTVEAGLQDNQDLGIVRIHATVENVLERIKALCPDLIILDTQDPHTQFVLPFFREESGVPLLCLDVSCSKVVALSCKHYDAVSASDLAHVIRLQTGGNGHRHTAIVQ
ncbi:MAG: hypothetical protein ACP5JJ_07330 [Anaerolineae bacterium]